ncbi:uncharacterized protein [Primulina eburnea]|uniref:uncharacterized protein n=1 Tax=Primulina eburnea TaxID=1245227 RepID=UPI003C6C96EE
MDRLFVKLKRLKSHLKWWNQDVFGNIFDKISEAETAVKLAESACETDPTDLHWTRLSKCNEDLAKVTAMEADFLETKICLNPSVLSCSDFSDLIPLISESENRHLTAEPSSEEHDVLDAVLDFFHGSPMPQDFTATTITLIPKVEGAHSWTDFCPISLCNVTNKIISKLIYSHMSKVVEKIISMNQSGFVPGRLISDNILLAQELIHSFNLPSPRGNVIIKLDMAKAYDRVQLPFLLQILNKLGFRIQLLP